MRPQLRGGIGPRPRLCLADSGERLCRVARRRSGKVPRRNDFQDRVRRERHDHPDKIKPKLLSRVGQPLNQDKVEADLKTLMGTKWFSDVRYCLDESPPKSGK